jgi:hypothetical protein
VSDRLRQIPVGCFVLFCVALVTFLASILTHGAASFELRQTTIGLLIVSALYRVFRPRKQQGTGPSA